MSVRVGVEITNHLPMSDSSLHFLFPSHPLTPRVPDDLFQGQANALAAAGFSTSLAPEEVFTEGARLRGILQGASVVYRGWMLDARQYAVLANAIEKAGAVPFISQPEYLAAHHLPNWFPLIPELTPETRVFADDSDLVGELKALGWAAFFIKDYVKSLKTSVGSVIDKPKQIERVVEEMRAFRGEIEGGICVRRVEEFLPETEKRFFVLNGRPFAADDSLPIPEAVQVCARVIPSKFFSVDVVARSDGELRVVEIGDGQVSDLVGWSPDAFARIWTASS